MENAKLRELKLFLETHPDSTTERFASTYLAKAGIPLSGKKFLDAYRRSKNTQRLFQSLADATMLPASPEGLEGILARNYANEEFELLAEKHRGIAQLLRGGCSKIRQYIAATYESSTLRTREILRTVKDVTAESKEHVKTKCEETASLLTTAYHAIGDAAQGAKITPRLAVMSAAFITLAAFLALKTVTTQENPIHTAMRRPQPIYDDRLSVANATMETLFAEEIAYREFLTRGLCDPNLLPQRNGTHRNPYRGEAIAMAKDVATMYGLDPHLILGIASTEVFGSYDEDGVPSIEPFDKNGRPRISETGAVGTCQVICSHHPEIDCERAKNDYEYGFFVIGHILAKSRQYFGKERMVQGYYDIRRPEEAKRYESRVRDHARRWEQFISQHRF